MQYETYKVSSYKPFLAYEFYSEGPKGRIKKKVEFKEFDWNPHVYNLAFGDDDGIGGVNDTVITDNKDSEMVLATVIIAVMTFFEHYPLESVFVAASTVARLRLYRILITRNLSKLKSTLLYTDLLVRNGCRLNQTLPTTPF